MRKHRIILLGVVLVGATIGAGGCARYYTPSTDFDLGKGAADCTALCKSWGMEMSGLVAMHDSNTGCICRTVAGTTPDAGR